MGLKKSELITGMGVCAQNIQTWKYFFAQISIDDPCPISFNPQASDKLLFNGLLSKIMEFVPLHASLANEVVTGSNIMGQFYYPQYSWWDEKEMRELKEWMENDPLQRKLNKNKKPEEFPDWKKFYIRIKYG